MAVLLGWYRTVNTASGWAENCSSLAVATSQRRTCLSAAAVAMRVLSTLNDSAATSTGCGSVSSSLPSAGFQTLTVLPTAAPTCVKSRLYTADRTGSGNGPNAL